MLRHAIFVVFIVLVAQDSPAAGNTRTAVKSVSSETSTTQYSSESRKDNANKERQSLPWWVSATAAVALINLVYTIFWNNHKRNEEIFSSIKDKYWFREIILPICIKPLVDFANDQATLLHTMEKEAIAGKDKERYTAYLTKFKHDKASVINRFMILGPISSDLYGAVASRLDNLEDSVTLYCAKKSFDSVFVEDEEVLYHSARPDQAIFTTLSEIMIIMSEKHAQLFR